MRPFVNAPQAAARLTAELEAQFAESARLEARIRESLKRVTYGG